MCDSQVSVLQLTLQAAQQEDIYLDVASGSQYHCGSTVRTFVSASYSVTVLVCPSPAPFTMATLQPTYFPWTELALCPRVSVVAVPVFARSLSVTLEKYINRQAVATPLTPTAMAFRSVEGARAACTRCNLL
jgi:hypothetical protein